jgi:hypothetical protein
VGGNGVGVNASSTGQPSTGPGAGEAAVPGGLVSAVVSLVGTGPVLLGAYTVAELTAVDAILDFLEARPPDAVLAEAVRSLAARELLVAAPHDENRGESGAQLQVRGDLGIAVAFQQRARVVLDARATGTEPGEPWRILLLPQPEPICLMVRIDALGVHELGLYPSDDALDQLTEWLPDGDLADPDDAVDTRALLASADRSALVTVTRYTAQGSAEVAGASTDVILARKDGDLHMLARDPQDGTRLIPHQSAGTKVRDLVVGLLAGA